MKTVTVTVTPGPDVSSIIPELLDQGGVGPTEHFLATIMR